MEGNSPLIYYASYNSVISDGRRVRRMRRTQLSAEKVRNSTSTKKPQFPNNIHLPKSQRSLAKIQPRTAKQKGGYSGKIDYNAYNQYYPQSITIQNNKNNKNSSHRDGLSVSIEQKAEKSQSKISASLSNRSNIQDKQNNELERIGQNGKESYKISQTIFKKIGQKGSSMMRNSDQFHQQNKKHNEQQSRSFRVQKQQNAIEGRGSKVLLQVDEGKNNSEAQSKKSQIRNLIKNSRLEQKRKSQLYDEYGLNEQIQKLKMQKQIGGEREHSANKFNISIDNEGQQRRAESGFREAQQIFSKEISNLGNEPSNISKGRTRKMIGPIIKGSSSQKQSWQDAIKSMNDVEGSQHEQKHNSHNSNTNNVHDSKKMSLRMDSMRDDNLSNDNRFESTQKNSWKHLPLASREPSQRKSIDSITSRPEPGSLKSVMESIQIHDYLITLIHEFKQETERLNQGLENTEILCFLLQKKHFLEKSNMIKALKGGRNVFKLSTIQIPNQVLSNYLENDQIKKIMKQLQVESRQLFKSLQKKYLEIKPRHKSNPYFKLETPIDNFSKQIVRILESELRQVQEKLKSNTDEEVEEELENRIFEIIELVFLISELLGRQVKKIQFFQEVADFQEYYNENEQSLRQTFQYFRSLK